MIVSKLLNKDVFFVTKILSADTEGICEITLESQAQFSGVGYCSGDLLISVIVDRSLELKNYRFLIVNDLQKFIWTYDLDFIGTAYPFDGILKKIAHVFLKKTSV